MTEALKEELLTACRILDKEGVMDELGHFSVRLEGGDRVMLNGKVSPGQATVDDLVVVDLDGNKLSGRIDPAGETPLHLAVYRRRPEVMAVAHTHSPTVVALSIAGARLRPVDNLGAATLGKEAPVFQEHGLVNNMEMGLRMADVMGQSAVLVLEAHGNVVAGPNIRETCVAAIWAEKSAQLQYRAMLLGEPRWYPEGEIPKVTEQIASTRARDRTWNYYAWRLTR